MNIKISYNGCYPNLCSGRLIVYIDNVEYIFPKYSLVSGGCVYRDDNDDWVTDKGEWDIDEWPEDFPEHLKEPVLDKVNEEIPWGCCGGCI